MKISTKDYELFGIHRIWSKGRSAQIAVLRQAYSIDKLYAWKGRHNLPEREWTQGNWEGSAEFRARVKRGLEECG